MKPVRNDPKRHCISSSADRASLVPQETSPNRTASLPHSNTTRGRNGYLFPIEIWDLIFQFATYCPRHPLLPVDSPSDWDPLYNRWRDVWQEARYHVGHVTKARPTRCNLMLVCKPWYNILVKGMYTMLALEETWRTDSAETTLTSSSHLRSYVKHLSVDLKGETYRWNLKRAWYFGQEIMGPERSEEDRLGGILGNCPDLELFVVFGDWGFPWCLTDSPPLSSTLKS